MLDPSIDLLPREIHRHTSLADTAIIYPAQDPRFHALAESIADSLVVAGHARSECVTDTSLIPERSSPLPDVYRAKTLIVLGDLNTNRTLQPLYADYLCSTDATYPGSDGYDLRTLVNPYGTGANMILVGGSSFRGVEQATEKLLAAIASNDSAAGLPYLLEVELDPTLAEQLTSWPYTPLEDSAELQALRSRGLMFFTEPIRIIGAYTLMWSWTANERYAQIAVEALRKLNAEMTTGYGDWHYLAERFMRAIPLLIAGGFLTDEEIARTDKLLLQTALGNQDEWWRVKVGHPPLGHRHQGKGTYEFLLLVRYLRDQTNPSPKLVETCDRWIKECYTFLDALARACLDDQDDESTLNNVATLYRYALGQERHDFFTSGNARHVAQRCLALHDNNGNGAGQGGYGESQGMYLQQEATEQTACSAFYYSDGELKWILHTMPNLEVPQRYVFLCYTPVFLQKFATGSHLTPNAPDAEQGVICLPVTDHQLTISNHPPEHVVPEGHMINAPETWQLPEGVGLNTLPQERGFDKLALRGGYDRSDTYLLIQGYQGGFRWQGHMQAANCIVRFYQHGHVWLVQNTSRHSYYDKNGLLISDGANDTPMPPIAEQVALADFSTHGLTVTRVNDYHHTDWTRHLFWSKSGDGFLVVIDRVAFKADGPYSLTCTWRTPAFAELEGRRWHSEQGEHRFQITAGSSVAATCEVDTDQGACSPYVLRQRRAGTHRAGDEGSFQNLLTVRPMGDATKHDLQRLDERSALVGENDSPIAWCAAELHPDFAWLPHAKAKADSAFVDLNSLSFAGLTKLSLSDLSLQSDQAISLQVDLRTGSVTIRGPEEARVSLTYRDKTISPDQPLPEGFCSTQSSSITTWFESLRGRTNSRETDTHTTEESDLVPSDQSALWRRAWTYDGGTRRPEIIRNLRVTADPLPINGAPDELLDPVMPDGYSRETWIQWPEASEYSLSLILPEPRELSALNILGDCVDDPTLRTFSPLPDGITVEAELADHTRLSCPVSKAPDRPYKRYRDAENRLTVATAAINCEVRALHIRFPEPTQGAPFVLHRLEALGSQTFAPDIEHWFTADLDGDGHEEIILGNSAQDLIVLDQKGNELWRQSVPRPITHISAQPIEPKDPPVLCVGLLGGDLHQYHADGSLRANWPVATQFLERKDCLQGWFNATHSINIWHHDEQGRGWMVLGGYAVLMFLNAEGDIVGHSFSDGPWTYDIMIAPEPRPDAGDLYVRCGWNHGIQYYPGIAGDDPSGEVYHLGGFNQPMFRMLKRVIPFLNGRSLAAEWIASVDVSNQDLFFATELGCGVLSTGRKDWHWKLEGGMSLNTATLGQLDGQPCALIGGMDGFLAAVDLHNGRVIRRRQMGAPVLGISLLKDGNLLVTTQTEIHILHTDWTNRHTLSRQVKRVLTVSDQSILLCLEDHSLELIELTSP